MLQSLYCSAVCAVGINYCCTEMKYEKPDCCKKKQKSCCANDAGDKNQNNGCQKKHVSFFKTIGKYFAAHATIDLQVYQSLLPFTYPELNFQSVENQFSLFNNTGFHPPPPNDEVVVLTHNFRI